MIEKAWEWMVRYGEMWQRNMCVGHFRKNTVKFPPLTQKQHIQILHVEVSFKPFPSITKRHDSGYNEKANNLGFIAIVPEYVFFSGVSGAW